MYTPLAESLARDRVHERQLEAEVANRARRLITLRRLERKAARVERQVRLARLRML